MSNFCHEFDKDYLPASFKGVPFFVDTISDSSGRRGVVGEFPFKNETDYADLGIKAQSYKFSGFFSGRFHIEQAKLFYEICRSEGAGILIHPTKGISCSLPSPSSPSAVPSQGRHRA